MKRHGRTRLGRLAKPVLSSFVIATVLIFLAAGCGTDTVGTSTDQGRSGSYFDQPYMNPADILNGGTEPSEIIVLTGQGMVDNSHGGEVVVDDDRFVLDVPSWAVSNATMIDMKVEKFRYADAETVILFDFGPDGLAFDRPATLRINTAEFDATVQYVSFYYLNPNSNTWELQTIVLSDDDDDDDDDDDEDDDDDDDDGEEIEIPVYHFSKYGVSGW